MLIPTPGRAHTHMCIQNLNAHTRSHTCTHSDILVNRLPKRHMAHALLSPHCHLTQSTPPTHYPHMNARTHPTDPPTPPTHSAPAHSEPRTSTKQPMRHRPVRSERRSHAVREGDGCDREWGPAIEGGGSRDRKRGQGGRAGARRRAPPSQHVGGVRNAPPPPQDGLSEPAPHRVCHIDYK